MLSSIDLLHLARTAADRAAELPPGGRAAPPIPAGWTAKGKRDFVTDVDRTAERHDHRSAPAQATRGSRIVGRGAEPRGGDRRPGLDRRSARRHHQLPAWLSGIRGVDRRGGGRRAARPAVVLHVPLDQVYHGDPGRRCLGGRRAGLRVSPISRPGPRPDRHRLPVQGLRRLDEYQRQFARVRPMGDAGSAAPDPAAIDLARCSGRAVRRLLGAAALGLGHRGGHPAGARGRRAWSPTTPGATSASNIGGRGRQPGHP